jgi:hypothetical protein
MLSTESTGTETYLNQPISMSLGSTTNACPAIIVPQVPVFIVRFLHHPDRQGRYGTCLHYRSFTIKLY